MRFHLFTLFPEMFAGPLDVSILKRAKRAGVIEIAIHDIREGATDRHRTVDDTPYGGGAGMVMMAPPVVTAVETALGPDLATTPIIVLSPSGRRFTQAMARRLAASPSLALICGHYEGIDDRVTDILHAEEVSIGDFVLSGGELAAMVIVDTVSRLVPRVIDAASLVEESHGSGLVEYPHYTRPAVYREHAVPDVLLSGHHGEIARWRREMSLRRTAQRRPDLLAQATLTEAERSLAASVAADAASDDTSSPENDGQPSK